METATTPPLTIQLLTSFNVFWLRFLLLVFSNCLKNIYYLYILGLNSDRISKSLRRESCQTEMQRSRKIKIALAGCNTSSLIDTLEGDFGIIDLENISLASIPETKGIITEDMPSTPSPTDSGPLEVELVFPTQATPLAIAGIPESLLPIHGPEMQSCYRCQFTDLLKYFCKRQQPALISAMTI